MVLAEEICTKYVNCSECENYQRHIFKYRTFPRGVYIPRQKCSQNMIYFILKGEVWVNSGEYPDAVIREGQFILQPMGSQVEFRVHTPTECIIYLFDRIQNACDKQYRNGLEYIAGVPPSSTIMNFCTPLGGFLDGMKKYLKDDMLCSGLLQAKRSELFFLFSSYYPVQEISGLYAAIYNYSRSFQYFVLNNYHKVKDVEEFAELGGYTVPTFRRIFRETFDEPVYQWLLKQRIKDIQIDLTDSDLTIKQISQKYGFDTLDNFSHFCRAKLGKSPRAFRSQ